MRSFRRWLDRKLDRRPVIRISRGSYLKRPWWRKSFVWICAVLLALVLLFAWFMMDSRQSPPPRVVRIERSASGRLSPDGAALSPIAFEARLAVMQRHPGRVSAVLLGRPHIPWVSSGTSEGGDHGR